MPFIDTPKSSWQTAEAYDAIGSDDVAQREALEIISDSANPAKAMQHIFGKTIGKLVGFTANDERLVDWQQVVDWMQPDE